MKRFWTTAALLGLLVSAGCADRGDNKATDEEKAAPEATAPAEKGEVPPAERAGEPSAREDTPTEGARATTGAQSTRTAPRKPAPSASARSRDVDATAPRDTTPRAPAASESTAAPSRRGAEWREITVPAGTALPLELETSLSSETAQVEAPVRAKLRQAVQVNGLTALPIGAVLSGEVTEVDRAGRVKGRSRLAFTFSRVQAENLSEDLKTNPLTYVGEASKGEDLTKIGAGAIGGAIVGGIAGGGEGAAKGAAIGGAAGTGVVLATRGKDVKLSSGTDLAATLAAPLTIRVPIR
jgi:hypothetical protein